ncbi:hypothetical protein PHYBOEH_002883 [Phytophthora boehmeriae]|uniref:RanBP2-type domain-containing protein n=1 Tax=Phytophthora boehmeriae TaxID=109152 RepID=A0A8T1WS30_9STRA|nr:hypothetical protein PHYBOEH_002883 [Phytophthora boehmeriae]
MEQDDASGRAPSSGRKRRSGGKRKRSASRVSEEEIKPAAAAEEAPNAKEQAAEDEEKPPAQWPCPTCTFLNEASRCYCEMCETPNPTPSAPKRGFGGASGATAPDWSCAACTVTNPGAMRVCAVCGTLNPRPPALTIGRLGAMSDEEFSDDSEDDDSDDSDEEGAWICRSCDMLATGNTCPECFSLRPKTADTTNSSKEDKEKQVKKKKRQKREKQKQERAKMAYGVSIFALKQLMQEPASSRLVDTLQTLTHTLAMMDASADSEWGDGPSFLIRSFGGMPSSSDTSKDPELLNVLANIFGEHERKYPVEVRLLAVQSINYLMKMDRHMFARSKMVEIVALYISALLSWKSKKSASSQESADVKSAQMVVEECLNGLSSLCYTEAFALREVLGRGNFIKYLDFMSILTDGNEGDNGFHPSIVMTALGILQKCCMKLRWSAKPSKAQRSVGNSNSQKPAALRISPKKSIQDSKFTLELATKLVSFLRRVLQHKHVPLHVKAAKCLLLIFHRTPYDHPEVIAKLVTSELLREFVAIVVNANGEESEESRLATISLLLHLFDNRPQLVSLFVKEGIYTELFSDMLLLLQSSSTALRTSTLKLTALLTRVVCRKHSSTPVCSVKANKRATISVESGQPSPRERKRSRLNSLPDPDVLSTLLLDFIRADSIPAVNAILKDGADLNFPKLLDVHGNEIDKPLHAAAEYASLGMVRFLVKRGADVHQVGPNGTALHVAAKAGRCDVAAFLLQCGARVQAKDRDRKSVMDVVKSLESSSEGATPSPMKKLLVLHQGTSGIIDYDSDLSESDSMCGNGSRTWFFPSDHEEDDYGDEDDDDMDDDELEDDEGHDYYLDYDDDDDDDDDFDRIGQSDEDMGDEDGVRDQETTYDDVSSSAIPSSRNFPLESIASESEMKTEEAHLGTPNSEHGGSPISSQLLRGGNDHFPGDDVVLDNSFDASMCAGNGTIAAYS